MGKMGIFDDFWGFMRKFYDFAGNGRRRGEISKNRSWKMEKRGLMGSCNF